MGLATPTTVQKLRAALHAQAKGSPNDRFYLLYDKVYRADVLAFAYRCCRANGGAPGVDGQDFADLELYGLERWPGERTDGSVRGCVPNTRSRVRGPHNSRMSTLIERWGWCGSKR